MSDFVLQAVTEGTEAEENPVGRTVCQQSHRYEHDNYVDFHDYALAIRIEAVKGIGRGLRKGLVTAGRTIRNNLSDVLIFAGLSGLGTGLWWFKPWVSLTVVGGLLFLLGIRASIAEALAAGKRR